MQTAGALLVASNGVVISIVVATILGLAWLISMVAVALDSISVGGKVLWWVLVTLLAPIAIPVYWVLRYRRSAAAA
jgi:hypothetical protein